ncbi:MAG: 2-oxoisovalerate dehydrogenase E1 component [Bacteroidia bacterium]|jgi:2-oxoisovalerate dehydrogenase E1 component
MTEKGVTKGAKKALNKEEFHQEILNDFRLANVSRQASLTGRKEVLTGKAKFGIFGDGKEIAQIAMAKAFQNGDFRSGYYRDQTFMMASDLLTVQEFFAQLYAHPSLDADPSSAGRSMNGHFSTRSINKDGSWKNLMEQKNSASDLSPTAGQIPRLLGLAHASKLFRENKELHQFTQFTNKGNEVAFGTIGDASTSEGHFWETMNAAAVTQVPLAISIWDDGYGISVPKEFQTVKASISEALSGFEKGDDKTGIRIFKTKGWDYAHLVKTYEDAIAICREEQTPVLIHVEEVTQPQGHSTSGSHERYKSKERLTWEDDFDCVKKLREFIIEKEIGTAEECDTIEAEAKKLVKDQKNTAWKAFVSEIEAERDLVISLLDKAGMSELSKSLNTGFAPSRKEVIGAARFALLRLRDNDSAERKAIKTWLEEQKVLNQERYNSYLYSDTANSATRVEANPPAYSDDSADLDGREILLKNFEQIFTDRADVVAFGEDLGGIGGVNQGFEGMQKKFGSNRVFDTGIREASIMGQGIGMALRGLRPIAEIQYLDYLLYGLQPLSDDLASLQYRTKGGQKCPLIIRTRGHRLEGIWHAGSPMGMIINSLRGIHICVPRNMTQAAGFYNTLLASDDPGLVIEPLNGYRTKEKLPSNLGEFKTPLGVTETIIEGSDLTIVTYGSCVNLAKKACEELADAGISAELIDVQTLLPFDTDHAIVESLKKTNRLLVIDEDVPGGASAYILQKILEEQKGYFHLDSEPKTLTAQAHRTAYGTDGDYFSKPGIEDMIEAAYNLMSEVEPDRFPNIFG